MKINKILELAVKCGLWAVPFLVIVYTSTLPFPFISPRGFYFRVIVEVVVALWLLLAMREPRFRPRGTPILYILSLFTVIVLAADFFGLDFYKSFWSNFERMEGGILLLHLFFYFLVAGSVFRDEDWGKFFRLSVGVSLAVALYALLQIFHEAPINQGSVRVDSTFGNALFFAVYLLLHIFLIGWLALGQRFKNERGIFISAGSGLSLFLAIYFYRLYTGDLQAHLTGGFLAGSALVFLCCLVYFYIGKIRLTNWVETGFLVGLGIFQVIILFHTATRGAIIGLFAGLAISAIAYLFLAAGAIQPAAKKTAILTLATIVLVVGVIGEFKDSAFIQRNQVLSRLSSISLTSEDAQARLRVWRIALKGFQDRPFLGYGQDSFNYVFNKYYDPKLYRREQWFDRVHNNYLDWLVAAGVFGALAFLAVGAVFVFSLFRLAARRVAGGFDFSEQAILLGLIAAYAVHNIFAFDVLPSYFVIFSILALVHGKISSFSGRSFFGDRILDQIYFRMLSGFILIGLVAVLYFFNARPIIAGVNLIKAVEARRPTSLEERYEYFNKALAFKTFATPEIREQLVEAASQVRRVAGFPEEWRGRFLSFALAELDKQIDEKPLDARYYLMKGVLLDQYSRFEEARPYLFKALQLSPNKQEILVEIGQNYLNTGNYAETLRYFKQAFELAPEFDELRIIYATGAIYAGDDKLAEEILKPVFGTTLIPDQRISRAYFKRGKLEKVITIWENEIKQNPENGEAYLYLAGAYLEAGRRADAIAAIKKAAEADPRLKAQVNFYLQELGE
jgi:O-antigen ligase/Flp pilus assembly protein TadD